MLTGQGPDTTCSASTIMIKKLKFVYRAYRFRYKIDPSEIAYILKHVKAGDTAVDIGSHKGGYLYWLLQRVGKSGKVFGFEPQVKLFNYLQDIIQTYRLRSVVVENKGLSSKAGRVSFFVPQTKKGDSPGARIDQLHDGTEYRESEIEITTLDQYFLEAGILPQFLKIDVEGHEKQVLLGGQKLLQAAKPRLLMECENRHLENDTVFDVFQVLLDLGYQGYFFSQGQLRPLAEFSTDLHQKTGEGRFWEASGYVNNFVFEPA